MVAALLAVLFAGAAALAVGTMAMSWRDFGFRFRELHRELRAAHDPVTVRFTWRACGRDMRARPTAVIYALDFKAKADGLPFHPQSRRDPAPALLAAA